MSKKIAIITTRDFYGRYDDYDCQTVINSITEWEEVTDEEFKLLRDAQQQLGFSLLEMPTDLKTFVAKTVSDWKKLSRQAAIEKEKQRKLAEEKALQKKLRAEQKKKETKKQLLERLKAELGEV